MDRLPDSAVVFVIDGKKYTKHDFLVASVLTDKLNRLNAGDPLEGRNEAAEKAVGYRAPRVFADLLRRAMMKGYAAREKISPQGDRVEAAANLFTSKFRKKVKVGTPKAVAEKIGGEPGKLLADFIWGDALEMTLVEKFDPENTLKNVTDADVMVVSNRWVEFNRTAAVSNRFERSKLELALGEIRAGGVFGEVAKKYSIDPSEAEEWDEFEKDDLSESPELEKWLRTAKPGAVSGILETDDSWSIVKLVDYKQDIDFNSSEPPEEHWKLVRICRKFWESIPPADRDEIVEGILAARRQKVQRLLGDAITARVKVEWPNGTNLFKQVTGPKKSVSLKKRPVRSAVPVVPKAKANEGR